MVEVVEDSIEVGRVVRVAVWLEGRNTRAVFVPFVRPKVVVVAIETQPVVVHEGEKS